MEVGVSLPVFNRPGDKSGTTPPSASISCSDRPAEHKMWALTHLYTGTTDTTFVAGPEFNAAESALLSRYFTNLDRPVFALRNLPEVVKGALFSRYSRTEKSLRRVLLDEFINDPESGFAGIAASHVFGVGTPADVDDMVAVKRADEVYERVLVGYGDDSVG